MLLRWNGTPHHDGGSLNVIVLLALSVTLPPCPTDGGVATTKLVLLAAVAEAIVALLSSRRVLISVIFGMALGVACVLMIQHPKEVASFLRLLPGNW